MSRAALRVVDTPAEYAPEHVRNPRPAEVAEAARRVLLEVAGQQPLCLDKDAELALRRMLVGGAGWFTLQVARDEIGCGSRAELLGHLWRLAAGR